MEGGRKEKRWQEDYLHSLSPALLSVVQMDICSFPFLCVMTHSQPLGPGL